MRQASESHRTGLYIFRNAQRHRRTPGRRAIILALGATLALAACAEVSEEEAILQAPPSATASARMLTQATFGPTEAEIQSLTSSTYASWLEQQVGMAPTLHLNAVLASAPSGETPGDNAASNSLWSAMILGPDQLRQRMAFALSQILVVADGAGSDLAGQPEAMAYYMDILTRGALGNYRDLLEEVTYSPAMATWLTYLRNEKANPAAGRSPDENYAREIMQLFTIGLVQLEPNGEPRLVSGREVETYTNDDVQGLARVFTGLSLKGTGFRNGTAPDAMYSPLQVFANFHETGEKTFLGLTIPTNTTAEASIDLALDHLVNHPNHPPFIARQLIQRFVTSDPSPEYVERVATAYGNGVFRASGGRSFGASRRGDLTAAIAAILLDPEARNDAQAAADFGKVREPVIRFTHWARAFNVTEASAQFQSYLQNAGSPTLLGQHPYRSASVFNFYRPGFVAPGTETGAAGLTAPELQIVNETSALAYVNFMSRYIRDQAPRNGSDATTTTFDPNYATELGLAATPEALADRLNLILTYGSMKPETRARIIALLNEIPIREASADADRLTRVQNAIVLATTAPEYVVQR